MFFIAVTIFPKTDFFLGCSDSIFSATDTWAPFFPPIEEAESDWRVDAVESLRPESRVLSCEL